MHGLMFAVANKFSESPMTRSAIYFLFYDMNFNCFESSCRSLSVVSTTILVVNNTKQLRGERITEVVFHNNVVLQINSSCAM